MAIDVQPAVIPHLVVDDAAAAIDFYVKAFGAAELGRVPHPDGKLGARRTEHQRLDGDAQRRLPRDQRRQVDDAEVAGRHAGDDPPAGAPTSRPRSSGPSTLARPSSRPWRISSGVTATAWSRDPFGHHWSLGQPVREVSTEEIAAAMGQS